MKQLLLVFSFAFSTLIFAQDWAPFKVSDTLVQFRDDQRSVFISSRYIYGHYIQSVHVKSKTVQSTDTVLIFGKGVSYRILNSPYHWAFVEHLVKGRFLGDTAVINADSSIFKTIDPKGFELQFPHHFKANQSWRLGTSSSYFIDAVVDSLFLDSVGSFGLDSIARIRLTMLDSINQPVNSHHFHNQTITITKRNGAINLVDFAGLDTTNSFTYSKYHISNTAYTNNDFNVLTTNDEYHSDVQVDNLWDTFKHISKIIDDTTIGTTRTMTIETTWQETRVPSNFGIDTTRKIFNVSKMAFDNKSLLVPDSVYASVSSGLMNILFESSFPWSNNLYFLEEDYSINPSRSTPGMYNYERLGLISAIKDCPIGFPGGWLAYSNGSLDHSIMRYIKKGNQTWGSPLRLTIGLNENTELANMISIYPNPADQFVTIKTDLTVQRILIFSANGQLIDETKNNKNISLEDLESGLYMLRVITEDGTVTKRLVID